MIIFIPDVHLDGSVRKTHPRLRLLSYYVFNILCRKLKEEYIPEARRKNEKLSLIFLGDVYTASTFSSPLVSVLFKFFKFCRKYNIDVYFIQGNHEGDLMHLMSIFGGKCLDKTIVKIDGYKLLGFNYSHDVSDIREYIRQLRERNEFIDIIVTHQIYDVHGTLINLNKLKESILNVSDFDKIASTIVNGHMHYQLQSKENSIHFLNLGTLMPTALTNPPPYGIGILYKRSNGKSTPSIRVDNIIPLSIIYEPNISEMDDLLEIEQELKENIKNKIFTIVSLGVSNSVVGSDELMKKVEEIIKNAQNQFVVFLPTRKSSLNLGQVNFEALDNLFKVLQSPEEILISVFDDVAKDLSLSDQVKDLIRVFLSLPREELTPERVLGLCEKTIEEGC